MNLDRLQLFPNQQVDGDPTECAGISVADVRGNMLGIPMDPDFSYAAGFTVMGNTPSLVGESPLDAVDGVISLGCLPASEDTSTALSNGEAFVMQFQNYSPQQKADALKYAANGKQYLYTFDDILGWLLSGKSGVVIPIQYYQTFNVPNAQGFLPQPGGQITNHCIAAYDHGIDGTQRYLVVKMWNGKSYGQGGYVKMYESIFEQVFLGPAFGFDPAASRWVSLLGIIARRYAWFLPLVPSLISQKKT